MAILSHNRPNPSVHLSLDKKRIDKFAKIASTHVSLSQSAQANIGRCYFCIVTGDYSLIQGFIPISIQFLTNALERILLSSVVMVLAFRPRILGSNPALHSGYGIGFSSGSSRFESCPVPLFLLCIPTLFVRADAPKPLSSEPNSSKKCEFGLDIRHLLYFSSSLPS